MKKIISGLLVVASAQAATQSNAATDAVNIMPTSFDASQTYMVVKSDGNTVVVPYSDAKDCERFAPSMKGQCISGAEAKKRFGTSKAVVAQTCATGTWPVKVNNSTVAAVSKEAYDRIDFDSIDSITQALKAKNAIPISEGTIGCRPYQDPVFLKGATTLLLPGRASPVFVPEHGGMRGDVADIVRF